MPLPDVSEASLKTRIFRVGAVELNESKRQLLVNGGIVEIERRPFDLLHFLLRRAPHVVTKNEIFLAVWQKSVVEESSLTTAVRTLRTRLGAEGHSIVRTVHGIGYQIAETPEAISVETLSPTYGFNRGESIPHRKQWCFEKPLTGSSEVWLAYHEKTMERRVFKFARTAIGLETLKREVGLSRILQSSLGVRADIIPVLEWNFADFPYFVEMPFGGDDLSVWATSQGGLAAIPLETRLDLIAQAARTIADAHDSGVLHGDVKPANIVIKAGSPPRTSIIDFSAGGLTNLSRREALSQTLQKATLVADGARAGTWMYAAPEILHGGPPSVKADVYALGILLYQLIVADLFRPLAAGWEAEVPDELLRECVAEAAAGHVDARSISAASLADRLSSLDVDRKERERLQMDQRRTAHLQEQAKRERQRRPWIALVATCLIAGISTSVSFALRAEHERDAVERQEKIVRAVNLFLTDDLLGRGNPLKSGEHDETLMEATLKAEPEIGRRLGTEPIVAGSIYQSLADAFAGRNAFDAARNAYKNAAEAFTRAGGPHSVDMVILNLRWAHMEAMSGEPGSLARAKQILGTAIPLIADLSDRKQEAIVWETATQALIDITLGEIQEVLPESKLAADLADRMPDVFDEDFRLILKQREAVAMMRDGQLDASDELLSKLHDRLRVLHGDNHPELLMVEMSQARVMVLRNKTTAALTILNRLLPAMAVVLGPDNRQTLITQLMRADANLALENYDAALSDCLDSYAKTSKRQGEKSYFAIVALADASTIQCRMGRAEAGLADGLHAESLARDVFGETSGITQHLSMGVASCLSALRQYDNAAVRLNAINVQKADTIDSAGSSVFEAELDLAKAEAALGLGHVLQASILLDRPKRIFGDRFAEPFFSRKLHQIENDVRVRMSAPHG